MMDFIANIFQQSSDEDNPIDLTNKLMDIILNYAKEHHVKQFDPFILRERQTFNFNDYVTLIINYCEIKGGTNFNKISNNININVISKDDKQFTIGCDIELTNLKTSVNFSAKLGFPKFRYYPKEKNTCISMKRCVFYIEFMIHLSKKFIRINKVTLMSKDRIKCTTEGFIWPFSSTVNTLIRKNIEQFINDNQSELERMVKKAANDFCSPHVYSELKRDEEFSKIVKRIKFIN